MDLKNICHIYKFIYNLFTQVILRTYYVVGIRELMVSKSLRIYNLVGKVHINQIITELNGHLPLN